MAIPNEKDNPVIIFGTTPDYVKRIFLKYPEKVLFIIDHRFRDDPFLTDIDKNLLLFTDTGDSQDSVRKIVRHIEERNITPIGLACYDCESLIPASETAYELDLDFPSTDSIRLVRNKVISKQVWNRAEISSPRAGMASNIDETLAFYKKLNKEVVLKPVSSSGSELVFHCRDQQELIESVEVISAQLKTRGSNPFYRRINNAPIDPCESWVVEEYIPGPEFSCDFILLDGKISILRITGKVRDTSQPFGSILAYVIPPAFPGGFSYARLRSLFKKAVTSLGFKKGFFMVDFILREGVPHIIEISPRPGGDSIPDLLEIAMGIDILGYYLDFVSGRLTNFTHMPSPGKRYASVNLFASTEGFISEIDVSEIHNLPWVKGIFIDKKVNDRVILPPFDYDSRKIGHIVAELEPARTLVKALQILKQNLRVSIHRQSFGSISTRKKPQMFMVERNGPYQAREAI